MVADQTLPLTKAALAAAKKKVSAEVEALERTLRETKEVVITRLSRGTVRSQRERCVGSLRMLSSLSAYQGGENADGS